MCLKYCFLFTSKKKKSIAYTDHKNPEINQYISDEEENNIDFSNYKVEEYYSPYCRRRPFNARRICINCNRIFYAYKKKKLCSKECSFSHNYNENFN
jgi:hypothetical protein